jgi:ribosomal protein S18 acetylase RimI-like enzyme
VIEILRAETEEDIAEVRLLWSEYWESVGLPLSFQGFGEQLRSLPGEFVLLIARLDSEVAGTVALRPLRAGACEVKRLYVPARFRGHGLGRKLLQAAIADARQTGYSEMYCDTLPDMQEAAKLYDSSGFTRVEPYSDRPTPGAIYFRLVLGHGAA